MATTTVDIESLKHELKAWERKFKQDHGTDKISKEDIKAHPDIDAKYKLWRELSKSTAQAVPKKQDKTKADRPATPRAPSRHSGKALSSNIFQKSVPVQGAAMPLTSNPFSPTKGKGRARDDDDDQEHTIHVRSHSEKKVAFESNPFDVSSTPISALPASGSTSSTSRSTDLLNLLVLSPSKPKPTKRTNIFATPAKSSQNKSFEVLDLPTTSLHSSSKETKSVAVMDYNYTYADSPRKLKALISSTLKDTPRTKSRKRLRGEEVNETPGDKRRRLAGRMGSQQGKDDNEDDEGMDLSPIKSSVGSKGKAFRPVFDETDEPDGSLGGKAPPFFSRTTSKGALGFSSALSRANSFVTRKDSRGGVSPPAEKTRTKRTSAELDEEFELGDNTTLDTQTKLGPAANPYDLRPLSPPPEKAKDKWGAGARKKSKVDVPMLDVEDDPEVDSSGEGPDPKEIRLMLPKTVESRGEVDSLVTYEEVAVDRFYDNKRLSRPRARPRRNEDSEDGDGDSSEGEGSAQEEKVEDVVQVDLPDEVKRILTLSNPSPTKHNRNPPPEQVVQEVLAGSQVVPEKVKLQQIWGVGELEGVAENEEDDWDSDPDGWKGVVEM
ncbi:hypothetical protein FRB93_005153 [Tulasnella sp. JGI-2019a]|nr:hypothetical protein FRB93_005153 [Tulasnella sp. JGI-2019a]